MKYHDVKMIVDQIHNAPNAMGMGVVRIIFDDGESHVAQTANMECFPEELIYQEVHMEVSATPLRVKYDIIGKVIDYTKEKPPQNERVRVVFSDGEHHWTYQEQLEIDGTHLTYINLYSRLDSPRIRVPHRVILRIEGLSKGHPAAKVFPTF